jgi:hypothetical protein
LLVAKWAWADQPSDKEAAWGYWQWAFTMTIYKNNLWECWDNLPWSFYSQKHKN